MNFGSRRTLLLILLLASVTCTFVKLDVGNLPSWDDAYYAQKAKEILETGDIWTMRIAGETRFDNPPGFMWAVAASYKVFGVTEFGARFPSALGGLLGVLGTFFLFELLFSARIGFLAALILNFTTVYLKYARHSMIDVSITAAGVWCFYFFLRGLRDRPAYYLAAGAVGSYVMFAKSLFGGLPLVVLFLYLIFSRNLRALKKWQLWAGVALYLAPYLTWCAVEYQRFGHEFIKSHFLDLIFSSATARSDNDNVWDYVVVLLKYFPIFLPFMVAGIWRAFRLRDNQRLGYIFALTYFFTYFVLLSIQGTTKTWYFIPALPACAGLAAIGMDRVLQRYSIEAIGRFMAGFVLLLYLGIQMTPVSLGIPRAVDIRRIAPYVRAAADQGFKILAYKQDYHALNNALLFYSDRAATVVQDEELARILGSSEKVVVMLSPEDWDKQKTKYTQLSVVRRSGLWVMAADKPLNQEEIFQQ